MIQSGSSLLITAAIILATVAIQPLQGQNGNPPTIVKNLYEALQTRNISFKDMEKMTPVIKWEEMKDVKNVNDRYNVTFFAIMKREWGEISFRDLVFMENSENGILVTGYVTGRQPTECEPVSTAFEHMWTLKNNEIINFKEIIKSK